MRDGKAITVPSRACKDERVCHVRELYSTGRPPKGCFIIVGGVTIIITIVTITTISVVTIII